jgi:hypothetical protein
VTQSERAKERDPGVWAPEFAINRQSRGLLAATLLAALLLLAPGAQAEKRVALVIGNNAHENVPQLQRAVNNADAVSEELGKLGLEVVEAQDVGRRAMSRALVEPEGKIGAGDTALVYFACHVGVTPSSPRPSVNPH